MFDEKSELIITFCHVTVHPWNVLDRTDNAQAPSMCQKYNNILSLHFGSTQRIYRKSRRADIVAIDHSNESPTNFRPKASEATLEVPISFTQKLRGFRRNYTPGKLQPDRFERNRTVFADLKAKSNPRCLFWNSGENVRFQHIIYAIIVSLAKSTWLLFRFWGSKNAESVARWRVQWANIMV